MTRLFCCLILTASSSILAAHQSPPESIIEPRLVHLRSGAEREWTEFPESPQGSELSVQFQATKNERECSLWLRQQDVKQNWQVQLNGQRLGQLIVDENDLVQCMPIPAGALQDGQNTLRISAQPVRMRGSDDIRIGQMRLDCRLRVEALSEATVEIEVREAETGQPLPSRLTIVDGAGTLMPTSATSNDQMAVRTGAIFTATGRAKFSLPAGEYTIYAGRGFEYSLDQTTFALKAGESAAKAFSIRREVPTHGYAACDTHIHTFSFSGHGDATIDERMITLAAEGIELPVATDHNVHIDYDPHARRMGVRQHFTPIMGNEVTTALGHFNIFPVAPDARVPNHRAADWDGIFDEIFGTPGVKVAVLNHARDVHSGTRPFGPKLHNAAVGENLSGWSLRFNAMEIVNSGATQTDPLQLARDWMALLNRGLRITPIGSSDSHDVQRHFAGQGRTYIRCDDRNVGELDSAAAIRNFVQGQVMVSYGLLAELTVDGRYTSGEEVAATGDELQISLRVLGPHWVSAERVHLYVNGQLARDEAIETGRSKLPRGVQWQAAWKLPRPKHDVHLVAIALGAGVDKPYWTTAKAYQPTSPDWTACTLGCSGAIWVDADGDGQFSSARRYAEQVFANNRASVAALVRSLADYDQATAAQAAHLYRLSGGSLQSDDFSAALRSGPPAVQAGFRAYLEAWRENELAHAAQ